VSGSYSENEGAWMYVRKGTTRTQWGEKKQMPCGEGKKSGTQKRGGKKKKKNEKKGKRKQGREKRKGDEKKSQKKIQFFPPPSITRPATYWPTCGRSPKKKKKKKGW